MGSRLRTNPDKLFEVFAEVGKPQEDGQEPFILQVYPDDYDEKDVLNNIPKFAFPCKSNTSQVDQFAFVLTDLESNYRFGYCRHGTGAQTCLCVVSLLPWFEVFYKMLNFLAEIINRSDNNDLMPFLRAAYEYSVPRPEEPVTIVARQDMFNFTAPDPTILPCIPASRNLTEYYNAVDTGNMMRIFASMLHERRIIITSKKLSRVTACIHAAEALLYPMHWQHLYIPVLPAHLLDYVSAPMPYLIGVHTSLMEKIQGQKMEVGDAVIVDADKNEVITEHEDLEALPEDVSSYLKRHLKTEKVKNSMVESGDAISRAFLQALVRLIGGYRDALKFHSAPITFDRESFVQSRSSQSMQAFLENMLQLQIFQQFINDRLELLNNGLGFHDLFEQESIKYADRLGTQSKYKEWLSKQGRKLKAGGKDIISDMKERAAPMMTTAVQSMKSQGKKAMSKIREINDNKMSSRQVSYSKGVTYSKDQRPSTIEGGKLTTSRPPRPPPPIKVTGRPNTVMAKGERSRVYNPLTVDDDRSSHDDSQLRLSYHRVDIDLVHDLDIQNAMMRSASAEILPQVQKDQSSTPLSVSDEDVSSTPSSDALSPSDENISGVPYVGIQDSSAQEASPFAASSSSDEDLAGQTTSAVTGPHASKPVADRLIISDRLIATKGRTPVVPPRPGRKGGDSQSHASSSSQLAKPPVAAPRRASMEKPRAGSARSTSPLPPKPALQEKPLIRFESSESETDAMDQFDPLRMRSGMSRSPVSPGQSAAGGGSQVSGGSGEAEQSASRGSGLDRNRSTRNSLMRAPAFRRQDVESPKRPGYRDDLSPDKDIGQKDVLADLFDPLANASNSSAKSSAKPVPVLGLGQSCTAGVTPKVESPESLMHDWTLDQLAGGSGFSRIPSGGTITCPNPTPTASAVPQNVSSMLPVSPQPLYPSAMPVIPPRPTRRPNTAISPLSVDSRFQSGQHLGSGTEKPDPLGDLLGLELGKQSGTTNCTSSERPRSQRHSIPTNVVTETLSAPHPPPAAARNAKPQWETFD